MSNSHLVDVGKAALLRSSKEAQSRSGHMDTYTEQKVLLLSAPPMETSCGHTDFVGIPQKGVRLTK